MMRGLGKFQVIFLMVIGVVLGWGTSVSAQAAANDIGYSVAAKLPKNQMNKKNSFFDLRMKSQQQEQLQVRVYNLTNQDIQVKSAIHTAWTSENGAIEYVTPAKSYDASLRYKMSDISKIQGKKTLTIPAKGSKLVTANVKMPKTTFNGVILGGWYFKRVDSKVTGTVKGAGNMRNQYSYVIGMKYTMGKVPYPAMSLGKVSAGLDNAHRGVVANLRNTSAVIIPNLTTNTTITNRDGGSVVKHEKKENVQMAPNTTFKYTLRYGTTELKAGNYHLHMVAKNTDRSWTFDRDFTITKAQADKYNQATVENSGINIWLLVALGALGMLLLILLILLVIYLIRRKRRENDDKDED